MKRIHVKASHEYDVIVGSNIIAGMFGFEKEELFASDSGAKSAPKVQF